MLDDVLLDIEPVALSADGIATLDRLADDPETRWYYRRRRAALGVAGLLAVGFNPLQPRGKDGKWIEVFGWIRWLENGKWRRGQVRGWSKNDGSMLVKDDKGTNRVFKKNEIRERVFSAMSPKATLSLPDPKNNGGAPGFTQVGPQGGSNPGGMFQVTDPSAIKGSIPLTPDMIRSALAFNGGKDSLLVQKFPHETVAANDPFWGTANNALILDSADNRVFSKTGNIYWDLKTNQTVTAEEIFGAPGSERRQKIKDGKIEVVEETEGGLNYGDLINTVNSAQGMAGQKPGQDEKFYIKTSKSADHARNEALANHLYELGGVPVPETAIGDDGVTFSSKIVAGEEVNELSTVLGDQAVHDALKKDYVFDAWLANWDVVGLNWDNVKVVDGVPYRIDAGGALAYRAMGSPKGSMFGNDVGELDTLIAMNPQSGKVFKGITSSQINDGAERLAAITPQDIINAVQSHGLDKSMSDKLIARRKFILDKYGIDEPPIHIEEVQSEPPEPPPLDVLPDLPPSLQPGDEVPKVYPSDISGMYYNADAETFLPGTAPDSKAVSEHLAYLDAIAVDKTVPNIYQAWVGGKDVQVVMNDGLWTVDNIDPDPSGTFHFEMTHAASGEKWKSYPLVSGDVIPAVLADPGYEPLEIVLAEYGNVWRNYRDHIANKYTEPSTLFNDAVMGQPGTGVKTVGVGLWKENVPLGSWVMIPGTTLIPTAAYKVTAIADTADLGNNPAISGVDLDGNEFENISTSWSAYQGLPGSIVNDTLDAIQARNIVAKTQDKNDADAPTAIAQSNVPTPTDTTMQKLSASAPGVDPSPDEILAHVQQTHPDASLEPPTPLPDADPPEPIEHFDPETGVNKNLTVVGDVHVTKTMSLGDAEALVGKKVYYRINGAIGVKDRGVYTLESAELYMKNYPDAGLVLNLRDASGLIVRKRSNFNNAELFVIEGNIGPILQYSEKKNGNIVVNGEVIGSWGKQMKTYGSGASYPTGQWEATINGKYTVSGKDFDLIVPQKKNIRVNLIPMLLPPGSGGSKPKPAKVKEIQKQIVYQQIAFGANIKEVSPTGKAVTLMDGAEAKVGMWTISKTDGKIGKITSLDTPPQAGVPGSVYVEYDDPATGKKMVKIRGAGTLSAAISPEGELPPGSPFYDKVKLADGSKPFASQMVMEGTNHYIIMGIKPDGSVRVVDADDNKKWTKASKLVPAKDYAKEVIVEVDADPAGVVAMAEEPWKTAPKAKKIPYAAPGGAVITQPSDAIAKYRQYDPSRKLTKDNFVPTIGMKVRDSKGTQYIIVKQNATFGTSNPSTVYVADTSIKGGVKPVARQPSALWVDHAAELSTWDGKPVPKVSKIFGSETGEQTLPDGSTVYSYVMGSYHGKMRTKTIKQLVITPDGKALYLSPNVPPADMADWQLQTILGKGVSKVAYIDSTSPSTLTMESTGTSSTAQHNLWVHDSTPGALEDLKIQTAKNTPTGPVPTLDELLNHPGAPEPEPAPPTPTPTPTPPATTSGPVINPGEGAITPPIFNGDTATLVDLPKPSSAPDGPQVLKTVPPPTPQSDATRLDLPPAVHGSYSIGSGIEQLRNQMGSGEPGARVLYTMGDTDYVEDMAIRLQSAVDKKTGVEMIEVRFRLLEDKVDRLGEQLIANGGQVKTGGWDKTPLKGPKEIVPGDAIAVRISSTGALKPADINLPNATVTGYPVLVGVSPNGFDAYSLDIVTAGGAPGTIIIEQRGTPSVPTYEWNPNKIISSSYFDASLNSQAQALGWSIRNDGGIGYEAVHGITGPDGKGRKVLDTTGNSFHSTSAHEGTMRLKYDAGEGAYMTVQVTHPASEMRQLNLFSGGTGTTGKTPKESKAIRHSVNGEVLIRVPAEDIHALDRISEMMSAAGVPPAAQGQPSGRDLRKMALNKVFKQFAPTYTHMQRPDVTGDDDASAQSVLSLLQTHVQGAMPNNRPVTMDDLHLHVVDDGRMEVVLSDDVARALSKKSKYRYAYHTWHDGFEPRVWTSKSETGLLSTDERYSAGILKEGGSSNRDVTHDAGNRVYFRFGTENTLQGNVILSPMAVNKKLDNYWSPGDYWGRREPPNTAQQYLTTTSFGGSNEVKIKRLIDPEMMAFVIVRPLERDQRLAELKAAGITHINGRPIEEIFVTSNMVDASHLGDLGAHYGSEIPITAIPLEGPVVVPPPPPPPVVVPEGAAPVAPVVTV